MSKLRVYELAKEMKKTNKEMLGLIKDKGIDIVSHMSTLSEDQIGVIKKAAAAPKKAEAPAPKAEAPKTEAPKAAEHKADSANPEEAPKKKNIVQVFRPQNTQNAKRQGQGQSQGQRPQGTGQGNTQGQRPQGQGGYQGNNQGQRPQGQRPQGQGGYQGNNQGQRPQGQGGYQGNNQGQRPQGQGGYQGNNQGQRPQGQGGYQGNNPRPQGQGGYQGNNPRPQGQGGYQGNNPRPQGQGGYQGNNPRPQGQGGYQGNNPRPQGQGGYQGNNPRPQGQGGYQGNNPRPQGQGGYQGNNQRPQGQGGYQGNNQGGRPGGPYQQRGSYQGKDGYQGKREGFSGDDRKKTGPAAPSPAIVEQKPSRTKPKDAHKKKDYKSGDKDNRLQKGKKGKAVLPQTKPVRPQPRREEPEEKIKQIVIPEVLTIQELAAKMKIQPSVIVKKLFLQGKIVTINQEVDYDTAEEIAMEFECLCEKEVVIDVIEELLKEEDEDETNLKKRPPVVCVMGHVDHGKTSLLDAIRDTAVSAGEAGGITQHIGASVVNVKGEKITFLDTPGHEAFTAMRMRGASSTDIAILVVAADDGVMPQTIEAINHAKAAEIEIVVAINKVDKPSANIERVKQELTEYELIPEDWGGSTIFVPVSAHTREGIDELMEMLLLTAEVLELKANPNRQARGLVIEGELDKGKGSVATVLVQKGTLRVGDPIAAGSAYGKVRAMMDDRGRRVKEAGPSTPVEILGLNDVPNAGEVFVASDNEKDARSFAETFISQGRVKMLDETKSKMSLDDLFSQIKEGNLKELGIIVKADVQGSVEALKQSLIKISNDEVIVKIIHGGVGAINESDVSLAAASNAIIIGFNVRPDATAKATADREGVDMRLYRVIYNAIEDVEAAMKGMLEPVYEEKVTGHAEIRQTFKASGVGTIAGSYVLDGTFERDTTVRVTRDGVVVYDGKLASLKRFKDDVKEVKTGYECGFVFERFNDVKEGDLVEAFKMVEVPR